MDHDGPAAIAPNWQPPVGRLQHDALHDVVLVEQLDKDRGVELGRVLMNDHQVLQRESHCSPRQQYHHSDAVGLRILALRRP
eukprot:1695768-Pyramimonas_sp.AAC.1